MKKILMTTILSTQIFALTALAEPYQVQQGLEKIKTNFDNSKINKDAYDKNLGVVNNNINEITKAKTAALKQKTEISDEIVKNNDSLKKVLVQEKETQQYIKTEQDKMAAEAKQIEQLEILISQIKKNQEQRLAVINHYSEQLKMTLDEKISWKNREGELRSQESEVIKQVRGVAAEETTWQNRKKGYEIEVKRWTAESEKQQKIFDTYQGLKEAK